MTNANKRPEGINTEPVIIISAATVAAKPVVAVGKAPAIRIPNPVAEAARPKQPATCDAVVTCFDVP